MSRQKSPVGAPLAVAWALGAVLIILGLIALGLWAFKNQSEQPEVPSFAAPVSTATEEDEAGSMATEEDGGAAEEESPAEDSDGTQPDSHNTGAPEEGEPAAPAAAAPPAAQRDGISQAEKCSVEALHRDPNLDFLDVVSHCEGDWMVAGRAQTDFTTFLTWGDHGWERYPSHGESDTGFSCYDEERLVADGAPASIIEDAIFCS